MTMVNPQEVTSADLRGEIRFLTASERVRLRSAVDASGWLLVALPPLGPGARGQLAARIEEAIESALIRRGTAAPGVGNHADSRRMLADQVYRARQVGVRGIIIALESLSSLTGPQGALGDEDSACLRAIATLTSQATVALWLSSTDRFLLAYGPPAALESLLGGRDGEPSDVEPVQPALRAKTLGTNWVSLAQTLDDAQGPKPLAAIERLFVEAYVPLSDIVRQGERNKRAKESLNRFSLSFEKSYREVFAAAKVTQKRPQMVFDAPQVAGRIARLHGAKSTTLVLVDGMRYDVGLRLEPLLRDGLEGRAVMTERVLLWSALPPITPVQLKLLERGVQGLKEPLDTPELQEDMPIRRGRTASILRRIRLGGREFQKLDVVQADLGNSGLSEPERLDALARAIAYPLIQLAETLPDRTLMFVFGDHGFLLPSTNGTTGPAQRPGAKPEEVLVMGQGWIVGGVH